MNIKKCIVIAVTSFCATAAFLSCKQTSQSDQEYTSSGYPFLLTGISDSLKSSYMISVDNLMKDSIGNQKPPITIDKKWTNEQWIINRGTAFFFIDSQSGKFVKYNFKANNLTPSGEIPFTLFNRINWRQWLKGDTLLIGGNAAVNTRQNYALIDTKNMVLLDSGSFATPAPPKGMEVYSCSGILRNGKLYLGYSLIDPSGSGSGKYANDTAYLATMDYPSLHNLKITKDARSTFPGSGRAGNGDSFIFGDDIYILSSPVDWNGQNRSQPTGFFRIKKGEDTFDKDYFFNISARLDNDDPDALIYLGGGKAIVRSCAHKNVTQWSDWSKEITRYVVIDVAKQTVKTLDLPLFTISSGGFAENGKAYLPVQTKAEGTFIYEYDSANDRLTRGIKVPGLQKFGKIYQIR